MRLDLGNWQAAEKAFAAFLEKGKMNEMNNTHLLIDICAYHRGDRKKAKAYLTRVLDDSEVHDQAKFWLSQLKKS